MNIQLASRTAQRVLFTIAKVEIEIASQRKGD
jgi:hypothetical protein